jgi:superoxide dismutase, Fe-Mn family
MTESTPSLAPAMELALDANFGSLARWRDDFIACAHAQGSATGQVLLSFLPSQGSLVNLGAAHAAHAVAEGVPLLVLDLHDHAPRVAHGAAAASVAASVTASVTAFMDQIDWAAVYECYQHAVHAASEGHGASLDDAAAARLVADAAQSALAPNAPLVIDVRRAGVFQKATTMLPGASWQDPAGVGRWAEQLPREREVLVYCIYGHEVGRATALRLRAAGVNARYLLGGINAWQNAGRPVQAKPAPTGVPS